MVEPRNTGTVADLLNAITPALEERELRIEIWRDQFTEFEGTAAQLRAERLIPDGFELPHATAFVRWEANGFYHWLRRTRPAGLKGPMKLWAGVDNWIIHTEVLGRDHRARTRMGLERKLAELQAEYHGCTAAGRCEWDDKRKRYWTACDDKTFQTFKALIPGLIPAKRGSKAKATTSGAAQ